MSKIAKYLIYAATYVSPAPGEPARTMGDQASRARPEVIEIDAAVDPSRTWLPVNAAAQEALARLGVHVPIVPEPGAHAAPREPGTMLEASRARSKPAHEQYGPRLADIDPLTGEPRKPEPPRLATDPKKA